LGGQVKRSLSGRQAGAVMPGQDVFVGESRQRERGMKGGFSKLR